MPWEVAVNSLVGPWIRRFLVEYLIAERNYSPNTQQSYRDTFLLFLPFAAKRCRCAVDRLAVAAIRPKLVREFLRHLETARHCSPSTINQRLAALRAWIRFVAQNSPEYLECSSQVQMIHLKKRASTPMSYLEKHEMNALLSAPDQSKPYGFRDYALLLFLYNTGARVSEACRLTVGDLDLDMSVATLHGKGRKIRRCPLWKVTASVLREVVADRPSSQTVFLNHRGEPLTRYGIHTIIERHARRAAAEVPSLRAKRISPHCLRHTTGMHLLRSGVDINTIRVWLGHVSLQTTHVYAESDLKMKAKALARCEAPLLEGVRRRPARKGLMRYLKTV
jgi:site-specific recombinase XerD